MRRSLSNLMSMLLMLSLTLGVLSLTGCGDSSDAPTSTTPPIEDAVEDGTDNVNDAVNDTGAAAGNALNQLGNTVKTALKVEDAPEGATAANSVCPFSGKPVNAEANMVVFQDKTYGFCCNNCYKNAKEAPEKLASAIDGN